jgi:hypothetical protein
MQDHLEELINELKSSQLIIKILQEEINSFSAGLRNQDNLTNCTEKNSCDELHLTNGRNHTWKEIHRTRTATKKHKRYNHTDQIGTDPFPHASNRYNSLYRHSESDDTPFRTLKSTKSRVVKPNHTGKQKMDHKKRVSQKRQHKITILGDVMPGAVLLN